MYVPRACVFDGSADYFSLATGFSGQVDGKMGCGSMWVRIDGGDGTLRGIVGNQGSRFIVYLSNTNKFIVTGKVAGGANTLVMATNTAYTAGPTWHNVMWNFDLSATLGQLYVNGAADIGGAPTLNDNTIDFTRAGWAIGSLQGGSSKLAGALAELWIHIGNSSSFNLDLSVAANRLKILTAALKPEDLGSDGSTPNTFQPGLYMKFADGALGTNAGSGGNFTAQGSPASAIGPVTPRQGRSRGAPRKPRRRM